jgi:MFS family permease
MPDMKARLSTLWIFATLNYIYCDVVTVMDPVKHVSFQFTQGFLLGASVLVEIPIAMVLLSRFLNYRASRWASIIAGAVMTVVQLASLFAAPAMYYAFFSAIEITCTALIVWFAWRWVDSSAVRVHEGTKATSGLIGQGVLRTKP